MKPNPHTTAYRDVHAPRCGLIHAVSCERQRSTALTPEAEAAKRRRGAHVRMQREVQLCEAVLAAIENTPDSFSDI